MLLSGSVRNLCGLVSSTKTFVGQLFKKYNLKLNLAYKTTSQNVGFLVLLAKNIIFTGSQSLHLYLTNVNLE